MIQVQNLSKTYGNVTAVRDVSFEVQPNEVVGFLGPNGAGKTTTLRIIAGFLGATRGRVIVDGHDIVEEPLTARACIGYMPENVPLYPELRVVEYLRYRAELKRVPRRERAQAVDKAMQDVRLLDHANVIIGQLSKGYRQRVGLADALVSRPSVLVLDEPTSGLDPNQIREVRELIRSLAKKHSVLLSTHIMSEVEGTCDRALVIDRGRLVAHGTLEDLRKLRRSKATRFAVRGDADRIEQTLSAIQAIRRIRVIDTTASDEETVDDDVIVFDVRWKADFVQTAEATEQAVEALVGAGYRVREAASAKASLEDVFALLTDDEQSESAEESADGSEEEDAS